MVKRIGANITDYERNMFAGLARIRGITIPNLVALLIRRELKESGLTVDNRNKIDETTEINDEEENVQKEFYL